MPEEKYGVIRRYKNDIIFVSALLLVIAVFATVLLLTRRVGDTVEVTVDGETYGIYPLSEDTSVVITTAYGSNTLVIKDGKALVTDASCPDGICSDHKPISYGGQSIICLPNKLVVAISSAGEADEPDIIS